MGHAGNTKPRADSSSLFPLQTSLPRFTSKRFTLHSFGTSSSALRRRSSTRPGGEGRDAVSRSTRSDEVFAACKAKCKEMKLVEFEIPQKMLGFGEPNISRCTNSRARRTANPRWTEDMKIFHDKYSHVVRHVERTD